MLLPNCCLLLLLLLPSRLLDRAVAAPPSCLGLDPCTPSPLDLGQPPSVGRERLPSPLGSTFIDTCFGFLAIVLTLVSPSSSSSSRTTTSSSERDGEGDGVS